VHLVTRGLFRSHDTKLAVIPFDPPYPKTPCYTPTLWLYVLKNRSYCRLKFYIAGIRIEFSIYLFAPVTLILTRWPSYTNVTRIPWRYTACANMNFLCQCFRKLSSNRDRQTNTRQTRLKIYTTPVCGWLKITKQENSRDLGIHRSVGGWSQRTMKGWLWYRFIVLSLACKARKFLTTASADTGLARLTTRRTYVIFVISPCHQSLR